MPDNFISVNAGDTLRLVGADTFTFSAAQFPTDGVLSLSSNFITLTNSPENFAGSSGSIDVPAADTTNVYVNFSAGAGGFGTEGVPFGTLPEALVIITGSDPKINIAPGSTTQTFPGAFAISTKVRLLNTGGGTVTIGAAPQALKNNPSGFHTRPAAKTFSTSSEP